MIFSTERVSANNVESFLFIAFLLIFAIAASAYVWIKGEWQRPLPVQFFRRGDRGD
jgi:cation-transporting ATPase 13A1